MYIDKWWDCASCDDDRTEDVCEIRHIMEEKPVALRSLLEDECMLDIVWPGGRTVVMDGEFVLEQQLCSNRLPMRPMSSDDAFEQEGATMVQTLRQSPDCRKSKY